MLHFRILASAVPLLIVGTIAGGQTSTQPCISIGKTAVQLSDASWKNPQRVSFTKDRAAATVRVQLVDSPEMADFTVADDTSASEADARDTASCSYASDTRSVTIVEHKSPSEPVIYLSNEPDADYRIYVRSKTFTPEDAAALVVGAAPTRSRQATL